MTTLAALNGRVQAAGLFVSGIVTVEARDGLSTAVRSLALLSPDEPVFWPMFRTAPEARDGQPDALDRWSRRVIGRMACRLGGKAYLPFGGPPFLPFIGWALRSGRAFTSPVGLLVHDVAGLFISYRGAIGLSEDLSQEARVRPCDDCATRPCLSACPVSALGGSGYDLPACHAFLDTAAGSGCMEGGCLVRRACPVGADRRQAAQSAFHMKAFHRHDPAPDPDPPRQI
jgi:epoxyqueuosine reductase